MAVFKRNARAGIKPAVASPRVRLHGWPTPPMSRCSQHSHEKAPPMTSLFQILMLLLDVAFFIVIAHVILSWLINFGVLNLRQPIVAQIWDGLNRLLEPVYGPIRRALPAMGGLDLAPLVVFIAIYALRIILTNNAAFFL
jgi:YggT family protein